MKRVTLAAALAVTFVCNHATAVFGQVNDSACGARTLVSTGGAFPKNPQTLAIRWTGYSNFELVYKNQIILLDAYFDRGSVYPPLGFTAADVKRANVILLRPPPWPESGAWTLRLGP